jgi:hypothetical protein
MKEIKDLCYENFKSLKRELEGDVRIEKIPCSWTCRIIIVNVAILPKAI